MLLINLYAPDHSKPDPEWDEFIGQLESAIASRATEDTVYIGGDFNAYCGTQDAPEDDVRGQYGERRRCDRGRQLVTLFGLHGLALATGLHPSPTGSHTTFHSHNSSTQIDYWAIDRRNTTDVTSAGPRDDPPLASNHLPVQIELRQPPPAAPRRTRAPPRPRPPDWATLESDPSVRATALRIITDAVDPFSDPSIPNGERQAKFVELLQRATATIPPAPKRRRLKWVRDDTASFITARNDAQAAWRRCKTDANHATLKRARTNLRQKLDADFHAHVDCVLGDMTDLHPADRAAQIADTIDHRTHRNRKRARQTMYSRPNGTPAASSEENVELAAKHFEATMTYPDYGPAESLDHLPAQPPAPATPPTKNIVLKAQRRRLRVAGCVSTER